MPPNLFEPVATPLSKPTCLTIEGRPFLHLGPVGYVGAAEGNKSDRPLLHADWFATCNKGVSFILAAPSIEEILSYFLDTLEPLWVMAPTYPIHRGWAKWGEPKYPQNFKKKSKFTKV